MSDTPTNWYNLDDLKLWDKNPNEGDVGAIITSIKRFGYNDTGVYWRGIVKGGNHRVKALLQLRKNGWKPNGTSACLRIDDNGNWQVALIDVSHMDEKTSDAFALALNRTTRLGQDDPQMLADLLQGLAVDEELLKATAFDLDDLDDLLRDLGTFQAPAEPPEAQIDKAGELQKKWQVQRGDVWLIPSKHGKNTHRIMCGDSTSAEDVAQLMNGERANLLLTDPPYGINMDKGFGGFSRGFGTPIARRQYSYEWDSDRPTIDTFNLLLKIADRAIIFGGNFFCDLLPFGRHWLVWGKNNTMPTFGDCELAWTNIGRKSVKKYKYTYNGLIGKEKERFHPTQKPVGLFTMILNDYSDIDDLIVDPYVGSGTGIVACEQTGRVGYGMELHPPYCAVALERLLQMGLTPERIASGEREAGG